MLKKWEKTLSIAMAAAELALAENNSQEKTFYAAIAWETIQTINTKKGRELKRLCVNIKHPAQRAKLLAALVKCANVCKMVSSEWKKEIELAKVP